MTQFTDINMKRICDRATDDINRFLMANQQGLNAGAIDPIQHGLVEKFLDTLTQDPEPWTAICLDIDLKFGDQQDQNPIIKMFFSLDFKLVEFDRQREASELVRNYIELLEVVFTPLERSELPYWDNIARNVEGVPAIPYEFVQRFFEVCGGKIENGSVSGSNIFAMATAFSTQGVLGASGVVKVPTLPTLTEDGRVRWFYLWENQKVEMIFDFKKTAELYDDLRERYQKAQEQARTREGNQMQIYLPKVVG